MKITPFPLLLLLTLAGACADSPTAPAPVVLEAQQEPVKAVPAPPKASPRFALVAFDGNSLTASRGGIPAYPTFIDLAGSPSINVAASGNATPDQDRLAATNLDPLYKSGGLNLIVFWEGANDLYYGASVQKALENIQLYVLHRHKVGFKVIIATLLPRNDAGLPADYEVKRQDLNNRLRAAWSTFADGFADLGADPDMGAAGAWANPVFFLPDRVHLNLDGARRAAEHVGQAIHNFGR